MTKEQQLMIQGMDMLLRKFNKKPDDAEITVIELIEAGNAIYDEIIKMNP